MRSAVLELSAASGRIIHYYSRANAELLEAASAIASVMSDADYGRMAKAFLAFLQAEESAALERSHLAYAFETGTLDPGQEFAIQSLVTAQQSCLGAFALEAADETVAAYQQATADPSFVAVARLERDALERAMAGDLSVDSVDWFRAMTTKLDRFREVEEVQLRALMGRALASSAPPLRAGS